VGVDDDKSVSSGITNESPALCRSVAISSSPATAATIVAFAHQNRRVIGITLTSLGIGPQLTMSFDGLTGQDVELAKP